MHCRHPTQRAMGFVISYSYRGRELPLDFQSEANSFIEGVRVASTDPQQPPDPTSAKWVPLKENERGVLYLEGREYGKDERFRLGWELRNYRAPDEKGIVSVRFLAEYDCKSNRVRNIRVSAYSGPMLTGRTIMDRAMNDGWEVVLPDTLYSTKYGFVCQKR